MLPDHTCVCSESASVESTVHDEALNRMRSAGKSSRDKSAFCLACKNWAAESPRGAKQEYNMCIRPHNIIYNRQTHFHTQMAFTTEVPPLALKERGYERSFTATANLRSELHQGRSSGFLFGGHFTAFCYSLLSRRVFVSKWRGIH